MESSYTATGVGRTTSMPCPMERNYQHPITHPRGQRGTKPKSNSRARGGERKSKIPVLSPKEAEARTTAAAKFLRAKGFNFRKRKNLRHALTPGVNLKLAQVGDKAQGLILADQWIEKGRYDNNYFQHCVFNPVGTNEHQALMATKHDLAKHIFPTAEDLENSSSQRGGPRDHTPEMKIRADTMEALMGAICKDGDDYWWETLENFMKVFELDFDAAARYRKR